MVNIRKFEKDMDLLLINIKEETKFQKTIAAQLANYFKLKLIESKYIMTAENWEKTKIASQVIMNEHQHIPLLEWKECIAWCFSEHKKADKFWNKVPIVSLGTVLKIYGTFKNWKESENNKPKKKKFKYGKL